MTLIDRRRIEQRNKRIEYIKSFCKQKYTTDYSQELFNIFYAGYDLARRRVMKGKEL